MQTEPIITFRGVRRSERLVAFIGERVAKLETYKQPITHCRVAVEKASGSKHGARFIVHVELTVPGGEIVVSHSHIGGIEPDRRARKGTRLDEPSPDHKHVGIAVRDAFSIARRRLQDFARRQRHD